MREGVKYKALSDVCKRITDGSHFSPKEDANGHYPMLSVKDMKADGFDYSSCKFIGEKDYKSLVANGCKPAINDVLVAKDGSYLKTSFVQNENVEQAILSSIAILTPNLSIVKPEFLAYFFKSSHTKAIVEKHYLTGTAIKRIILKGFRKLQIPIPSLAEQDKIIGELDLLKSIIDKQRQQVKELDNLARSIFYGTFSSILDSEPTMTLKEVASYRIGLTYNPTDVADEGIVVLRSSNIQENELDFNDVVRVKVKVDKKKIVNDGDILMCARNGSARLVGKVARIKNLDEEMAFGAFMTIISSKYNDFLFYFFLSDYFRSQLVSSQTATVNQITTKMLDEIKLNVPSLEQQSEFASKIQAIESQKESINRSIAETQKLFDYTMDKYFG